jgi:glycerol-3-phosphate acyltransferase PlsY
MFTMFLLALLIGYLCGSISFARLVARLAAPNRDITDTKLAIKGTDEKYDMGAVSATTVSIHLGPRLGFLTAVLDMLKIVAPLLAFRWWYPAEKYFLLVAVAGMIGHIWPVWYGFKGGRGLTAVYGALLAIDFIGAFVTFFGGMALGIFVLRDLLVAYTAGLWLLIPWLWFRTSDLDYVWYAVAANVIYVLSMLPDIRKYLDFKRRGLNADISEVVQLTGMGRGMYRVAKRFGMLKEKG